MKNTLSDLNNYLFEQIERLQDNDLTDTQLDQEIKRAEAVRKTADTIIQNASLAYRAFSAAREYDSNVDTKQIAMFGTS